MSESSKRTAISGVKWTVIQQIASQAISLGLVILLGKILSPKDYGLLGMVYFIFTISNVLLDSGFSSSLIRNPSATSKHFSVVFNYNLIMGIALYMVVFLIAPAVANFFSQPILKNIVRIYGLTILVGAFSTTQQAYLSKTLQFKSLAICTLVSSLLGATVGVVAALCQLHVWSLVLTTLVTGGVNMVMLWSYSSWFPRFFLFDSIIFKLHFKFGYKLTITNLIDGVSRSFVNIVLGRLFTPTIVGYYSRSESLKNIIVNVIGNTISKVSIPVLSSEQDSLQFSVKYKILIDTIMYITFPIFIFVAAYAREIILLIFTDEWLSMVFYLQALALAGAFYPVTSANFNSLIIKGRSDLVLKANSINKLLLLTLIGLSVIYKSITLLLICLMVFAIAEYIISAIFAAKFTNYPFLRQGKQIIKVLLPILFIPLIRFTVTQITDMTVLILGISSIVFMLIMMVYIYLCDRKLLNFIKSILH
ncbi:MAG: lipopolysaccharide biosynthesis protein [Chryseobacterium sp.]|nr:MAG: lipopolysaccharide biosynthesis protein [Chryseobacterium sp.]